MNTRKLIITVSTTATPIDCDVYKDILTLFKDYPINTAHSLSKSFIAYLPNDLMVTYQFVHFDSPTSFECVIFYQQELNAIRANIDLQTQFEFTLSEYKYMGGYQCWRVIGNANPQLVDKHFTCGVN